MDLASISALTLQSGLAVAVLALWRKCDRLERRIEFLTDERVSDLKRQRDKRNPAPAGG